MVTQTEAIARFLNHATHPDLAGLYNPGMEVQVNVAQDNGERIDGEYMGKRWVGWTDNVETWKSIRIPYKANSEPVYTDKEMSYDIVTHAEGIGMTGWNFQLRKSIWVAYDFDAITGHSDKHSKRLSQIELEDIEKAVANVPWVTMRRSTGGNGLHLYVFVGGVHTNNHTEHAALARAILGMLSAITGFDFKSKVDVCGGNMWVWHRKMKNTKGLTLIKQGDVLTDIPENWRDHIKVISGRRKKATPAFIEGEAKEDAFAEMCGQNSNIPLDEEHKKLIDFLREGGRAWWWDQDHHMLVCHTSDLKDAHLALNMKGVFETMAKGTEKGVDHNCFCYPLRKGAWSVRRYTEGVAEAATWEQDGQGWTKCLLNTPPDLKSASRRYGGIEHKSGGFVFHSAESAQQAAILLGVDLGLPLKLMGRKTKIKQHKDGRLIAEVMKEDSDTDVKDMENWLPESKTWTRVFTQRVNQASDVELDNYDDSIRHLITIDSKNYGWVAKSDGEWRSEPLEHIKPYLQSLGLDPKETVQIIGNAISKPWKIVNYPFQAEYIGDRIWNRSAVQFRYPKKEDVENLNYPTWLKVLNHCGKSLDDYLVDNPWAKANGIKTGGEYLKCWIASLFQVPTEPLPYLFFYGPQNSGKSIFHEALELLITGGVARGDSALISQNGFNAELEYAILCVIEELDLRSNKVAYNRIKDWVTSKTIAVHPKGKTPYNIANLTHWVQFGNDKEYCPVFQGDTRITMLYVGELTPMEMIPKRMLIPMLEKEAADFLTSVLNLEIPPSNDRLNIPVISTAEKQEAEDSTKTAVEIFLEENCFKVPGEWILFADFCEKFKDSLSPSEQMSGFWSKIKIGKSLPYNVLKGTCPSTNQVYIGNYSFRDIAPTKPELMLRGSKLVRKQ